MSQRGATQRRALMQVEVALAQGLTALLAREARVMPRSAQCAQPAVYGLVAPAGSRLQVGGRRGCRRGAGGVQAGCRRGAPRARRGAGPPTACRR